MFAGDILKGLTESPEQSIRRLLNVIDDVQSSQKELMACLRAQNETARIAIAALQKIALGDPAAAVVAQTALSKIAGDLENRRAFHGQEN